MKTKEIVYMIMDLLKNASEDSYFTEDHVLFLIKHHRSLLLKQEEERKKYLDNTFNMQTICVDVEPYQPDECGDVYLRSVQEIPETIGKQNPIVSLMDYYGDYRIAFVTPQKMKYVNNNRFMNAIIYCSIGPDKHLYFKSSNPQFLYLEQLQMQAVFDDVDEADKLSCDSSESDDASCDFLDKEFPIDSHLVPYLIDSVLKELLGATYRTQDKYNDDIDNLSQIELFLRNNLKSNLTKQIEGNEQ